MLSSSGLKRPSADWGDYFNQCEVHWLSRKLGAKCVPIFGAPEYSTNN
jgi:hypothetical protein